MEKGKELVKTISSYNHMEVLQVIFKSKLANPSKQDMLSNEDWEYLAKEVQKDYSNLTIEDLNTIITLGIKGKLDDSLNYSYVNFKMIYKWIDTWIKRNKKGTRLTTPW